MKLALVALPVPVHRAFTYAVRSDHESTAKEGARVICSFGNRLALGVIVRAYDGDPPPKIKSIERVLPGALPLELMSFLTELSRYYFAPIGEVMKLALPPVEKETTRALREPSLFEEAAKGVGPRKVQWVSATDATSDAPTLTPKQARVLSQIALEKECTVASLEEKIPGARAVANRLSAMGLVSSEVRDAPNDPFFDSVIAKDSPPTLTQEQARADEAIGVALARDVAATFLLSGVTGSGKTEVYLRAIERAKQLKKGSILLVPEIALTPQLVSRFRARFGDDVGVIHSGLSAKERHAMWTRLRSGEVNVAIGARSAVFAPVENLGLVIVDEEHDPSFKQEEGVRYHARDMAILRAHRVRGTCVLGSATPSLESELLVRTNKAERLRLTQRAHKDAILPTVEIIDLRRTPSGPTGDKRISLPLHRALEKTLNSEEQAILFLNRRGFSPSVRCSSCGHLFSCPDCSVAMTFHKSRHSDLRCHYCDRRVAMPEKCDACSATSLVLEGLGTEKLEEAISEAFPKARVARLDRDVAHSGDDVELIMARVRRREVDILVGTQMVTKGHDLPHVTLVGVVNADAAISMPDFRAAERAFQLLVQVAGRAGRAEKRGRVLVQTYDPSHHAIILAAEHDVDGFVERELEDRRELFYPPFSRAVLLRVDAVDERVAKSVANDLASVARAEVEKRKARVDVVGPAPAPIARIRGRFRFRVMLRSADRRELREAITAIFRASESAPSSASVQIDIDPVQLL